MNPPPERLRPTLQLKIKAKSWNGLRQTPPGKIKANSSTENQGQVLEWIKVNPPPLERLRPTLQLKIKAKSWNGLR